MCKWYEQAGVAFEERMGIEKESRRVRVAEIKRLKKSKLADSICQAISRY